MHSLIIIAWIESLLWMLGFISEYAMGGFKFRIKSQLQKNTARRSTCVAVVSIILMVVIEL